MNCLDPLAPSYQHQHDDLHGSVKLMSNPGMHSDAGYASSLLCSPTSGSAILGKKIWQIALWSSCIHQFSLNLYRSLRVRQIQTPFVGFHPTSSSFSTFAWAWIAFPPLSDWRCLWGWSKVGSVWQTGSCKCGKELKRILASRWCNRRWYETARTVSNLCSSPDAQDEKRLWARFDLLEPPGRLWSSASCLLAPQVSGTWRYGRLKCHRRTEELSWPGNRKRLLSSLSPDRFHRPG